MSDTEHSPCQCHEQGLWFCWCPVHHGAPSYKCPVCAQMIEDGRTYLYGPKSEGREHLFPSKESK